jgi:MFS family permease
MRRRPDPSRGPLPKRQIIAPVVLPLLVGGLLIQAIVPLARIVTTYRAIDLGLGASVIGLLSAVFALLPVFLTTAVGRYNDSGASAKAMTSGALGVFVGCAALWLLPPSLPAFLVGTAILGVGQTLSLSSMQMMVSTSSSRAHRDSLLGNYMVAMALGQALGPLFLWMPRDSVWLLVIPVIGAAVLVAVASVLLKVAPVRRGRGTLDRIPLGQIAATRGLPWIVVMGSICVTAQDLLLAFMPVLGEQRGIAPAMIGLLLSARAIASMLSRLAFGMAVRHFGRMPLMLGSAILGGAGLLALAAPLPVWTVALALVAAGLGLGVALTSSIALTLVIAPPAARGTALSMRLTANRIAQFSVPLLAGLIVAPLGAGGIFALIGAALRGTAVRRPRGLLGSR